ncbi:MAG: UTP--glucose-1-phosphate uridylyltransferase [Bacteriovoracaceae bacterium]|nr:UTP--glucose-1-phosphate uridylyltransferase [Bacteriovoracaceae bacterium]
MSTLIHLKESTIKEQQVQKLLDTVISSSENKNEKEELKGLLGLDDLNLAYYLALYGKYKSSSSDGNSELPLYIHEENVKSSGDVEIVYPTAIANKEQMKILPAVHYKDLVSSGKKDSAKKAALWIKKMQAGTGSSMTRNSYLADELGITEDQVKIGAKGTDLFIPIGGSQKVSIAEAQVLQAITDEKKGIFGSVILHDIVSSETEKSISSIWEKDCFLKSGSDYRSVIEKLDGIQYFGKSFQYHIPTLDENDVVSFNRVAPGGHALFGVDALMAAYRKEMRPKVGDLTLVSSVGNGEDLSSSPDAYMVNWMVDESIPIAMVTTTKTSNDMKGGQIAVVPGSRPYITMMEKAQAETANQLPLFESLGLRPGDNEAFFNTNMVLFNYSVLSPKIERLVAEIGEDEFLKVIAPDLIQNKKSQVDTDGVERSYLQLEGAMGTVVLNLDRYWREHYGEPIVHFLNVDAVNRTQFFCPIKTAFDYFMQFHSERFAFDPNTFRLINLNPGELPMVNLKAKDYKDVGTVLTLFSKSRIKHLKELNVTGVVDFSSVELVGEIDVVNEGDLVSILPFADDGKIKDSSLQM